MLNEIEAHVTPLLAWEHDPLLYSYALRDGFDQLSDEYGEVHNTKFPELWQPPPRNLGIHNFRVRKSLLETPKPKVTTKKVIKPVPLRPVVARPASPVVRPIPPLIRPTEEWTFEGIRAKAMIGWKSEADANQKQRAQVLRHRLIRLADDLDAYVRQYGGANSILARADLQRAIDKLTQEVEDL